MIDWLIYTGRIEPFNEITKFKFTKIETWSRNIWVFWKDYEICIFWYDATFILWLILTDTQQQTAHVITTLVSRVTQVTYKNRQKINSPFI